MLKNWKSQKGYTGIDVAIAIIILLIFTLIISTIFTNIYMQYTDSQRNSVAMSYLTSVSELIDKMYYQDVYTEQSNDEENLEARINELFGTSITSISDTNRQEKLEITISNSYKITIIVSKYNPAGEDLVKNVNIEVSYKVNNANKSIKIDKIKAKEILITPNKPQLQSGMVPVKFIVTDFVTGEGFWQISSENDTTWYNYENKVWASAMLQDGGLTVEGGIQVREDNMSNLVGKKIIKTTQIFKWIPRYTLSNNDVVFLYSTSDKFINLNGNLEQKDPNSTVSDAFSNITGFWIAISEDGLGGTAESVRNAVSDFSQSKYGTDAEEFKKENISNRQVIIVR